MIHMNIIHEYEQYDFLSYLFVLTLKYTMKHCKSDVLKYHLLKSSLATPVNTFCCSNCFS